MTERIEYLEENPDEFRLRLERSKREVAMWPAWKRSVFFPAKDTEGLTSSDKKYLRGLSLKNGESEYNVNHYVFAHLAAAQIDWTLHVMIELLREDRPDIDVGIGRHQNTLTLEMDGGGRRATVTHSVEMPYVEIRLIPWSSESLVLKSDKVCIRHVKHVIENVVEDMMRYVCGKKE